MRAVPSIQMHTITRTTCCSSSGSSTKKLLISLHLLRQRMRGWLFIQPVQQLKRRGEVLPFNEREFRDVVRAQKVRVRYPRSRLWR